MPSFPALLPLSLTALVVSASALPAGPQGTRAAEFHVAPGGSDTSPGTQEAPFATLEGARDALRRLKAAAALPPGGATVWIHAGTYHLPRPLELGPEDGGASGAPVTYRALPGARPRLSGGRPVRGLAPPADPALLERLEPRARAHVLVADLGASGLSALGDPVLPGERPELFSGGQPMTLARWPDEGFILTGELRGGEPFAAHGIAGNREGKFTCPGSRLERWAREPDLRLHGYWFWDWSDGYEKVAAIDVEERLIATQPPYHHYGYRSGQRYYALNALCELDRPGEWYLERPSGRLFFWPPGPLGPGDPVISWLPHLLILEECSWVAFEGLVLEGTRSTAARVEGGRGCLIAGCTVRHTGGWGIEVTGGAEHRVVSCDLHATGEGGISLSGGDRRTLAPSGHAAENNHIHHFARLRRTYRPAVGVRGVGQRVAHNLIHDGPHNAILLGGNDHVIEFNEIHHVCYETGDVGAFYMGRDWTERGTVIQYNYFHHIEGPGLYGAMAVYLDDAASGITVRGNIFYRASRAAFIGGGRDNLVENNVFVDCQAAVHVDARGAGWMRSTVETTLPERLRAVPYREPPWSERYPQLLTVLEDDPGLPKGNVVRRNISAGGHWLDVEPRALPLVKFEDNLVDQDPHFADPAALDFRLLPDSPALALGFEPLPVERIGLAADAYRPGTGPPESPAAGPPAPPASPGLTDPAATGAAAAPAAGEAPPAPRTPGRPEPPGPHVRRVSLEELSRTAFRSDQPLVGTYFFYWYDIESKAHFIDGDGTDALTRHPAVTEGYSYELPSWHRGELLAILDAGIDFILPVYWGHPGGDDGWSFTGLPPLVAAAGSLEKEGKRPPRIGCFYDTSTLRHNSRGFHADLRTPEGKEWLYTTVRDFFSMIPPDLWATIEGRPLLWLYSAAFARAQDPAALDHLRRSFAEDFGVRPFVVKEISWQGEADATYAWGAALRPSVHGVAAVGPGYDHSAVPGRQPLVKDREGGAFYRRSWEWILAMPYARRPRIAVVETWNEWHEATDIAPSKESGRLYVELTREYADRWHRREEMRPRGPYAERREVTCLLGEHNRPDGLVQSEAADGKTRAVEAAGRSARATLATRHGGRYIYFEVADSFYWASGVPLEVEITFLDQGSGAIPLEYDSADPGAPHSGAFKPAPAIRKGGTGAWRTARVRLDDAAFTGRANGNDFRLADTDGALAVHRVAVRKLAGR